MSNYFFYKDDRCEYYTVTSLKSRRHTNVPSTSFDPVLSPSTHPRKHARTRTRTRTRAHTSDRGSREHAVASECPWHTYSASARRIMRRSFSDPWPIFTLRSCRCGLAFCTPEKPSASCATHARGGQHRAFLSSRRLSARCSTFAANFFFSSLLLDLLTADELEKGEREKESDSRCTTDVHGIVPVDRGCGLGLGRIADSVSSECTSQRLSWLLVGNVMSTCCG